MKLLAAAALGAAVVVAPASATLMDFDDLPGTGVLISNGYNGFDWSNFGAINGSIVPPSGYPVSVVSSLNVAFSYYAAPATISSASAFSLTSAYLTAAWNDGLTVQVDGSLGGSAVFTQFFTPSATAPTLFVFNHAGIDTVVFTGLGGTLHPGYEAGAGTHFILDNLIFTVPGGGPVPEPAGWALMIVGFGLVGVSMRRRKAVIA